VIVVEKYSVLRRFAELLDKHDATHMESGFKLACRNHMDYRLGFECTAAQFVSVYRLVYARGHASGFASIVAELDEILSIIELFTVGAVGR
jgi:hypothetical protein